MEAKYYYLTIVFNRVEKDCPFTSLVIRFYSTLRCRERNISTILSHYSMLYDIEAYLVSTIEPPTDILFLDSFDF